MNIFAIYFLGSFLFAVVFIPIIGKLASKFNVVDRPQGALAIHSAPVPLLGGLAVFACVIAAWAAAPKTLFGVVFAASCGVVFFVGLWDDIAGLAPFFRFAAHIAAGLAVAAAGFLSGQWVSFGFMLFAVLLITGSINAFNMADGMDGLCAGFAIISLAGLFAVSVIRGDVFTGIISASTAGAALGFLAFNFHPAKIFLGDAGSGLLGFIIAALGLVIIRSQSVLDTAGVILIAGVPLFDMSAAVIRRFYNGRPLFLGDRDHVYDLMLKKGYSQRFTWLMLCLLQAALSLAGIFLLI